MGEDGKEGLNSTLCSLETLVLRFGAYVDCRYRIYGCQYISGSSVHGEEGIASKG